MTYSLKRFNINWISGKKNTRLASLFREIYEVPQNLPRLEYLRFLWEPISLMETLDFRKILLDGKLLNVPFEFFFSLFFYLNHPCPHTHPLCLPFFLKKYSFSHLPIACFLALIERGAQTALFPWPSLFSLFISTSYMSRPAYLVCFIIIIMWIPDIWDNSVKTHTVFLDCWKVPLQLDTENE